MSVSAQRRLPLKFALFPYQLVLCVQHNEVVDVGGRDEILLTSCAGIYIPTAEEDDIGAADIGGVAVSGQRGSATHSDSGPEELLGIEDSDIV